MDCRSSRPTRRGSAALTAGAVAASFVAAGLLLAQPASAAPTYTPATAFSGAPLTSATDVAVSADGSTAYVLSGSTVRTLTGSPLAVTSTATVTGLLNPQAISLGGSGGTTLYIADTGNHRVVSIPTSASGAVAPTAFAGDGTAGPPNDAVVATSSHLNGPRGLAWDAAAGALYIADTGNNKVEKVVGTALSFVAGTGFSGPQTPGQATSSYLAGPQDVAVDTDGTVYIADTGNSALEKVTSAGQLTTVATLSTGPSAVAVDATGTVLAASGSSVVTAAAGAASVVTTSSPVTLHTPRGLATTTTGAVWVADDHTTPQVVTLTPPAPSADPPHIMSAPPAMAAKGLPLSRALTATGSPKPTWSVQSGTLPAGVALSAAGVLSGTPTASGSSTFTLRATNSQGYDDQVVTLVVGAVPATITAAPTVAAGQGSATVTWTAPAPPTGNAATSEAITGYVVTPYAGTTAGTAKTIAAGTLSTTVSALKAGTAYTFTVAATNAFGTATASAASVAVTPYGGVKEPPAGLTRYEGGNRVATAVKVSQQLFPDTGSARAVVVASSTSFADSLAGARLASAVGGPLLLTDPLALNSEVAAEVGRVLAVPTGTTTGGTTGSATTAKPTATGTVYLLGGTSAVSAEVETAVKAVNTKYAVTRISGTDRFETATKIADQVTLDDPVAGAPVYVASGTNYPDGLAVAALAARTGGVLLLTDGATMPTSTLKYLQTRDPNSELLVAVGGPAAAATSGHGAERAVVGSDRYDTARKVAARFTAAPGAKAVRSVGLATGQNWPDALAGAAAMGNLGGPLLLTPPASLSPSVASAVASLSSAGKPSTALVFGGSSVVSTGASDAFAALVR